MGCCGSKIQSQCVLNFLLMLKNKTNLNKYQHNKESVKALDKAMASDVFGGSVLLPIGQKGKKRTKSNPIYDEVIAMETKEGNNPIPLDILQGGGYYILQNVRKSFTTNEFVDIWVLVESVSDKKVAEKMNEYTLVNPATGTLKLMQKSAKPLLGRETKHPLFWDDIKKGITGYARLVHFVNHTHVF